MVKWSNAPSQATHPLGSTTVMDTRQSLSQFWNSGFLLILALLREVFWYSDCIKQTHLASVPLFWLLPPLDSHLGCEHLAVASAQARVPFRSFQQLSSKWFPAHHCSTSTPMLWAAGLPPSQDNSYLKNPNPYRKLTFVELEGNNSWIKAYWEEMLKFKLQDQLLLKMFVLVVRWFYTASSHIPWAWTGQRWFQSTPKWVIQPKHHTYFLSLLPSRPDLTIWDNNIFI